MASLENCPLDSITDDSPMGYHIRTNRRRSPAEFTQLFLSFSLSLVSLCFSVSVCLFLSFPFSLSFHPLWSSALREFVISGTLPPDPKTSRSPTKLWGRFRWDRRLIGTSRYDGCLPRTEERKSRECSNVPLLLYLGIPLGRNVTFNSFFINERFEWILMYYVSFFV